MDAKKFTVALNVTIREWNGQFDWIASNGDESDELFDSVDEAENDARGRY